MKTIIKLAISNNKKNQTRSILIIASVVLTTMLLSTIGTFVYGSYQSNKANAKILYGGYHGVFREVDEEAIRQLNLRSEFKTIGKMAVAGSVEAKKNTTLYWADDTTYELTNLNKRIMDGNIPRNETDILAEKAFFKLLGYPNAQIGDNVILPVRADLESVYEPKEFVISGFLKEGNSQLERRNYLAYVAEKFYKNQTKGKKKDYSVLFLIDDSVKLTMNRAEGTIQELGEKCGIEKEKLLINDYYMNWSVNPGLDMIIGGIMISGCILLFSIIVIYNIFQVGVVQKIQEYGKIKALGATKRQIRSVVLMEGMLLAVIGSPLGIVLGSIMGKILFTKLMSETIHIREDIELVKATIISLPLLGGVLVVSLFSIYFSLRKPMKMVGRLSPVNAIRYQEHTLYKNSLRKGKINLTILSMTLANLSMNRKRTITTIVTMGLSCVLFVVLASMIGSIDNEYDARKTIEYGQFQLSIDYSLSDKAYPQNNLDQILKNNPLDQGLIQTIKKIDGVTNVKTRDILAMWIRNIEGEEAKMLNDVAVLDQESFSHMANEGGTIGVTDYDMATKENSLLYGWSHFLEYNGYNINQPVRAQLETGQSSVSLEGSIQGSFGSSNQNFAITKGTYDKLGLTEHSTGYIWIDCEEKDRERIKEQLKDLISNKEYVDFATYQNAYDISVHSTNMMKIMVYSLLSVLGVIGFFNMANTMIVNIITRKREIGVLQAIGMTNKQLNHMLQLEGIIFTIGTVLIALLIGIPAGYEAFLYGKRNSYIGLNAYHFPLKEVFLMILAIGILQMGLSFLLSRNLKKDSLMKRIRHQE